MDRRYIGVFDSGMGGVSVLRQLVLTLPAERYLYYGDTKNAPYGDKPQEEILGLTKRCVGFISSFGIKALVIACNTATSAAVQALRQELDIPVIGMEPALKPAALERRSGKVLVMATQATIRQEKFHILMGKYGKDAICCPCPGLMEFVERGEMDSPALDRYLNDKFRKFKDVNIESAVLGCTHYVFLKKAIQRHLPGVRLYDGNEGTARRLVEVLTQTQSLSGGPGEVKFMSSEPKSVEVMESLFRSQ